MFADWMIGMRFMAMNMMSSGPNSAERLMKQGLLTSLRGNARVSRKLKIRFMKQGVLLHGHLKTYVA